MTISFATSLADFTRLPATDAAASSTINFQARLENLNGSIVADGTYNVEFNLYNVSSGGSSLWTEDRLVSASQGVTVKNGYLTANLGSVTAFPTNIWNQQLWLGMTVRGITSCSWASCTPADTEMTPRLSMTAVPAAYSLVNTSGTFSSNLTIAAPTGGNQSFVLQDQTAAGTYNICIQNSAACGFAPSSGTLSGSYIQNTSTVQTSANFYVRSAATSKVGGVIEGASGQTADLLDLNTFNGTVSTTVAKFDSSGNLTAASAAFSGNITFASGTNATIGPAAQTTANTAGNNLTVSSATGNGTGAGGTLTLSAGSSGTGATGNGGAVSITGGNAASTNGSGGNITIDAGTKTGSGTNGTVSVGAANASSVTVGNTSGTVMLQGTGALALSGFTSIKEVATALSIDLNNASNSTLSITNTGAGQGNLSVESNVTVGALTSAGIVTNTAAGLLGTVAVMPIANGGTNSTSANLTTNGVAYYNGTRLLTTAASTGAQCLQTSGAATAPIWGACGSSVSLGAVDSAGVANANGATFASGTLNLNSADGTHPGALNATTQNIGGNKTFLGTVTVNPTASATAFLVQNANGNALAFDTTSNTLKVYENVASPTNYASISYASGTATFAASSGTTKIGNGGSVTGNLTGSTDVYNFNTTYTPTAAYGQNNFTVQRTLTGAGNSLTGSVLNVQDQSTGTASSPNVLLINEANSSSLSTTNLINAQLAGASKFSVTTAGNLTTAGSLTVSGLTNCTSLQTSGAGLFSCGSGGGGTLQGAYTASTGGTTPEILLDSTRNGVDVQDANTTIGSTTNLLAVHASATATTLGTTLFGVQGGGFITMQPAASLTNGQTEVVQTATFANAIASGTVIGYQQNITVSSSTAATNKGFDINVTDTSTTTAHMNIGLAVTVSGSNTSQNQIGVSISTTKGVALKAVTSGTASSNGSCANSGGGLAYAICADNTASTLNATAAVYAHGHGAASSAGSVAGAAVIGYNDASLSSGNFGIGIQGMAQNSGSAATTSIGIYGNAYNSTSGTAGSVYGGYFTIDGSNNLATSGAALYATTPTYSSTASSGINAVNVLQAAGGAGQSTTGTTGQVAGNGAAILLAAGNGGTAGSGSTNGNGGSITLTAGVAGGGAGTAGSAGMVLVKNAANSSTAFQIQNTSSVAVFGVDTSANKILVGAAGAQGNLVISGTTSGSITITTNAAAGTYTLTLPNTVGAANTCLGNSGTPGILAWNTCAGGGGSSHTKTIQLTAEYAGAVLDAASDSTCSSANAGTMTSGYDGTTTRMPYYNWTVSGGTTQCYDVVATVPIPSDFSSWNTNPLSIQAKTSNTSNSSMNIDVRDGSGTVETSFSYAAASGLTTSWANVSPTSNFAGSYSADGFFTIRIRMSSKSGANLQLGNIKLTYTSAY